MFVSMPMQSLLQNHFSLQIGINAKGRSKTVDAFDLPTVFPVKNFYIKAIILVKDRDRGIHPALPYINTLAVKQVYLFLSRKAFKL
jgi:hypothetical protein